MMLRRLACLALLAALAGCAGFRSGPAAEGPFLVFFETGSATLTPEAREIVRQAAEAAEASPPDSIVVLGHASTEGTREANQTLSARRVRAVERALEQSGVAPALLRLTALGEATARRADVSERYVRIILVP